MIKERMGGRLVRRLEGKVLEWERIQEKEKESANDVYLICIL